MKQHCRVASLAAGLGLLAACGAGGGNGGDGDNANHGGVLRGRIGIDLSSVSAFASLSGSDGSSPARPGAGGDLRLATPGVDAGSDDTTQPKLFALTLSGESLEVKLVEPADPQSTGPGVTQPKVIAIYATPTWVLFSAPAFSTSVRAPGDAGGVYVETRCDLIAARRSDGVLFCSPLWANLGWGGQTLETSIDSNAAGDVIYLFAGINPGMGSTISADSFGVYKLALGGDGGPTATLTVTQHVAAYETFRSNAAGDLFISYMPSVLDGVLALRILPVGGGPAYTVQGTSNSGVMAGKPGDTDENTFYVASATGGGRGFDGTIRVVARDGASFVEQDAGLNLVYRETYADLFRLSDGGYMFDRGALRLVRVVAGGALVANPVPVDLVGVDRVAGGGGIVGAVGGRWVFIAAAGSSYKFVRHDGVSQQDIPLPANLDVSSFTVARTGAIDFLGIRTDTQDKIHGTVAAAATEAVITSAGALDPAKVVAFTRIN